MTTEQLSSYLHNIKDQNRNNIVVYEFGTAEGNSAVLSHELAKELSINIKKMYCFDSFDGFPAEANDVDKYPEWFQGNMKPKLSMQQIEARLAPYNISIVRGFFDKLDETTKGLELLVADFVYMDADLYISTIQAYEWLLKHGLLKVGTIVGYDEWNAVPNGGEKLAHAQICDKYGIETEEFWGCNANLVQKNFIIRSIK